MFAGFTTNRVAEVAGVSIGSLYPYFPNKSAWVAALIEREQATLAKAIVEKVAASNRSTLSEALGALVDIGIAHQFGNPLYAAALDHEEKRLPLESVLRVTQNKSLQALLALLQRHFPSASKAALGQAAAHFSQMSVQHIGQEPGNACKALCGPGQHGLG